MSRIAFKDGLWHWSMAERVSLARLVLDNALEWADDPKLAINPFDYSREEAKRLELLRSLYDLMLQYQIGYALEPFDPRSAVQRVRPPSQILINPRVGTCLDLSLLFCGLCMGCDLIPWIVILSNHAFVLVSLEFSLREMKERKREENRWFPSRDPLRDRTKPLKLLDEKRYVAIECTGFSRATALPPEFPEGKERRDDGTLDFDAALRAGEANLRSEAGDRVFDFALDLAIARFDWGLEPDQLDPPRRSTAAIKPPTSPVAPLDGFGVLPLLCDRTDQTQSVTNLIQDVIDQETSRPLVFLIVGDVDQEHLALIHRLGDYDLPESIHPPDDQPGIERVQIDLPNVRADAFDLALRRNLARKLKMAEKARPTWEQITVAIERHSSPVMFHTSYDTSAWEQDRSSGFHRLEALLESWSLCGDLSPKSAAIVCVQAKLEAIDGADGAMNREFEKDLDRFRDWFESGDKYPALTGKVLEKLASVSMADLKDWEGHELVIRASGSRVFSLEIEELIKAHGTGPRREVPMSRVIPALREWLQPRVGR